jgi:Glycosyltransferase family 87
MAELLPAALALAGWWKLRQLLYHIHWERGPTIVLLVVASIALVLAVPLLARIVSRGVRAAEVDRAATRRRALSWVVAAALASAAVWSATDELAELRANLAHENATLLDIGGATWAAARRVFDYGQNPYTHVTQLQRVSEGPGVKETADGRVEIFGVPYYYGFAYFPATFLSYQPFRWIDPGQDAIRIGNAFWLAVLLGLASWLAWRLSPPARRPEASALAALLLLVSTGLGGQLFFFGITDIVIPVFALSALVAASYRSHLIAGCAMGLAFAAKLLPSALIALVFFAWLARRGGLRPALLGFVATSSIVLLPFVLWDPAGFLSATLLFYVAHHAGGDTTSLWYYLPGALRLPFQALGAVATLGVALWPLVSRSEDQRDLLRAMVVAALLFLASSPMIHLNYQFAVVPLACVVLAADAMGPLVDLAPSHTRA